MSRQLNELPGKSLVSQLVRRAQEAGDQGAQLAVIGGLRFPNDAAVIREAGGKILQVIRPNAPQPDATDPTERERALIQADTAVINNGTIADLTTCAQQILTDIANNQLKPEYVAQQ